MIVSALNQSLQNVRANWATTVTGIITASFSLVILGTFSLVYQNMINLTEVFFDQSHYSIFLKAGTGDLQKSIIKRQLRTIWGMDEILETSSAQARNELIASFGESGKLLEKVGFADLPEIIDFTLTRKAPLTTAEIEGLRALDGVDELVFGREAKDQIENFFAIANFVGVFLIVLFVVSIAYIIRNSIQIAIRLQIKEIEILKILGATSGFIRGPFVWEGVLIALGSFILSMGIIYFVFQFIIAGITFNPATYGLRELVHFFPGEQLVMLFLAIVLLGVFSSVSATNKILRQLDA